MASGLLYALNALLNLVLAIVLARILPAAEFGRFSVLLAVSILASTVAFDWVRSGTFRYYTPRTRVSDPAIRATLDASTLAMIPVCIGLVWVSAVAYGVPVTWRDVALIGLLSTGNAIVECVNLTSRVQDDSRGFARQIMLRHGLVFLIAVPATWSAGTAETAIVAIAAAVWPAALYGAWKSRDPLARLSQATLARAAGYARYAVPLIAADGVLQSISIINRSWLASSQGYEAVGPYALAFDLAFRIAAVTASVGDIILFPKLLRAHEQGQGETTLEPFRRNVALMLFAIAPVCAGFWLVAQPFAALIVSPSLAPGFVAVMPYAASAGATYVVLTFVLRPAFQISTQTLPFGIAAACAFVVDLLILTTATRIDALVVSFAHMAALFAGILALLAIMFGRAMLPRLWGELARITLAVGAMVATVLAIGSVGQPWLDLSVKVAVGGVVYVAVAVALDICGVRTRLLSGLRQPVDGA